MKFSLHLFQIKIDFCAVDKVLWGFKTFGERRNREWLSRYSNELNTNVFYYTIWLTLLHNNLQLTSFWWLKFLIICTYYQFLIWRNRTYKILSRIYFLIWSETFYKRTLLIEWICLENIKVFKEYDLWWIFVKKVFQK